MIALCFLMCSSDISKNHTKSTLEPECRMRKGSDENEQGVAECCVFDHYAQHRDVQSYPQTLFLIGISGGTLRKPDSVIGFLEGTPNDPS